MSVAGNADASMREGLRKYLWFIALALSYAVTYPLIYELLQGAKLVNPYIGYKVTLESIALYVSSLLVLMGAVLIYLFRSSSRVLNAVLTSSLVFVLSNYLYIYSLLQERPNLRISVYPFILLYSSSTGHASVGVDLGQITLLISAVIIALKVKRNRQVRD